MNILRNGFFLAAAFYSQHSFASNRLVCNYRDYDDNMGKMVVYIDVENGYLKFHLDSDSNFRKYVRLDNYDYRPSPLYRNYTAFRMDFRGFSRTIFVENTLLINSSIDAIPSGRISFGGWDPEKSEILCD